MISSRAFFRAIYTVIALLSVVPAAAFADSPGLGGVDLVQAKKEVEADLEFLALLKLEAATPIHQQVFGEISSQHAGFLYDQFLKSRIRTYSLVQTSDPSLMAFVTPKLDPHRMNITENFFTYDISQIARLSILIHESRHSEAGHDFWFHVKCPEKDLEGDVIVGIISGQALKGELACDDSALGAYGVQTEFLKNVEKFCSNCTDKVRMDAKIYGDSMLLRIVDEPSYRQLVKEFKDFNETEPAKPLDPVGPEALRSEASDHKSRF